jgi:hypothetical protein
MEIDFLMKLAKAYNRCDCFTEFNNRQRLAFGSAPAVAASLPDTCISATAQKESR